ncbi:hypothetical protein QFZ71_001320 [Streptomyces sp. V2I9]|nr:hypothetical protein [Streptomyces sp. V2I9]
MATSAPAGSTCLSVGVIGPAPSDATYAASWSISRLAVDDLLLRYLGARLLRGHTARTDLEVHGGGAHAHEGRPVGGALTAGAVAAGAAYGVELLALFDGEGLGGFIGLRLARRRKRGVQPPGSRQREE